VNNYHISGGVLRAITYDENTHTIKYKGGKLKTDKTINFQDSFNLIKGFWSDVEVICKKDSIPIRHLRPVIIYLKKFFVRGTRAPMPYVRQLNDKGDRIEAHGNAVQ